MVEPQHDDDIDKQNLRNPPFLDPPAVRPDMLRLVAVVVTG